ncbi:MAG: TonB-dependent receptor plug domain-containing protein [Minicystis sp.]
MEGEHDGHKLSIALRLGVVGGAALAVILGQLASAMAQLPAAPAPPAVPSGIPTALPSAVPTAIPTAIPSGLPSALPSAAPRPPPLPPPAPAADKTAAPRPPMPPPRESDVILFDAKESEPDQVAGRLPKELHVNAEVERKKELEDTLGLKVDTPVVTPSMRKEGTRAALGSVIILTKRDLWARGYADLSQMLDDLPGMDVVRPWGDSYVRSYVRGNRTAGADPYLLLIDGVEYNQLFTRSAEILATLPISAVEKVEVVYGPLSSVYGPGAAMGVINVITANGRERQEAGYSGASFDARTMIGGPQNNLSRFSDATKMVDTTASYIGRDYRVRLSARLESGTFDRGVGEDFEFTKSTYYRSNTAWGAGTLKAYPDLAGVFRSPDRKGAVDARVFLGRGTEIAGQFLTLSTGYGVEYPGDRRQTAGLFTRREWSAYARHTAEVTSGLVSTTLLQFRKSDLDAQSLTNDAGSQVKLLNAEAPSSAALVREDLEINTKRGLLLKEDQLGVGIGVRYQHLTLPNTASGYNVVSSSVWAPSANPTTAAMVGADQVTGAPVPGKGFDEIGAYLLTRYSFNQHHHVNVGVRVDKSSTRSDINASVRAGYSGTFLDMLTFKILYGHSIFEPSWQQDLASVVPPARAPGLLTSRLHTVQGDSRLHPPLPDPARRRVLHLRDEPRRRLPVRFRDGGVVRQHG